LEKEEIGEENRPGECSLQRVIFLSDGTAIVLNLYFPILNIIEQKKSMPENDMDFNTELID